MKRPLALFLSLLFLPVVSFADLLHDSSTIYKINVAPNINLRVTYTAAKAPTNKVVILIPGRSSFFEKNKGLILGVTGHSYEGTEGIQLKEQADVWNIEMRGHGESGGRLGDNDQRCHIDSFETYLEDIHKVITSKIAPAHIGQNVDFYLLGTSAGGHLALRYLQDYSDKTPIFFKRTLLVTPMVNIHTGNWPRLIAEGLVNSACTLGYCENYAPGYGPVDLSNPNFEKFKGHHNRRVFDETNAMMIANPQLLTGGPTYGWVKAAFESEEKLYAKSLPNAQNIIAYVAGNDLYVNTNATLEFCKTHKIEVKYYPKAYHNLLKESKEYAPTFWEDLRFN